jgi:7-keto-8-aminopelargonate synthetase-like enzyme
MNECINLSENDYLKLQVENRKLAEVKFSWQKLAEDLFVYD